MQKVSLEPCIRLVLFVILALGLSDEKYHLIILVFFPLNSFSDELYCFNVIFGWTVGPLMKSTNYWWFRLYLQYIYLIIYSDYCLGLFFFFLTAAGRLLSLFFYLLHLTTSGRNNRS